MSEWTTRIQDHRVWGAMQALGPSIDRAVSLDDIESTALEALERLRTVLAFCGKRIGGSDPLTVLPAPLEPIATSFDSAKAEIDAFVNDRDRGHLDRANSAADTALAHVAQIPGVATSEELTALIKAASAHRAVVEEQARLSSESRKQLTTELQEIRSALNGLKNETDSAITDLKAQLDLERQRVSAQASEQQKLFTDAQQARSNSFNETLLKIQDNLSKTISDHQGQFSAAQENRGREFTAAQTESQKRLGDLIGEYTKALADQDAEFTKQRDAFVADAQKRLGELHDNYGKTASEILEQVNLRRKEVEKLVGVIGNLGVTSGYQTTANHARSSMWVWQGIAVASMIAVILFARYAFLPALQGDFKWGGFATRVFITITVGVLAAYAVRQADRFCEMARYNRELALELAAIDPFIALLPEEQQHKFKLEMGNRAFGQNQLPPDARTDKSPATALDLLLRSEEGQQVLKLFEQLIQKLPKVG